ncbi:MAG: carbohydrate kinase [Methylococcaceae bacterium]|nr:carbohydrate kinase [Methylococcaceae bacterium]
MSKSDLCVFGEVLFDHFPDGTNVLGGAPFNVSWHLQAFGQAPCFISRVGDDVEGRSIKEAMTAWGMRTDFLQTDSKLPTGRVSVNIADGEPSYDIVNPCAYDAIEADNSIHHCQLLYHGSLALRESTPRQAVKQYLINKPEIVFVDVNLRPPWWKKQQVLDMVSAADWVKLNSDELKLLHTSTDGRSFLADYNLQGLVLTHGADGAEVLTANGETAKAEPAQNISVVDTVGAGDAFASVIILGLSKGWSLSITVNRAQDFASALVGYRGATVSNASFYRSFIDDWDLG